jgi:hypothetical protein
MFQKKFCSLATLGLMEQVSMRPPINSQQCLMKILPDTKKGFLPRLMQQHLNLSLE